MGSPTIDSGSGTKSYLVGFKDKTDKEVIKAHGGKVKKQYKHIPVVAVDLPEKEIEQLAKNRKVDYIEENAKVSIDSQVIPWGISHIHATESQQLGYSGKGIKVGVIDTGIDHNHEDLHVSGGTSVIAGTTDYYDDNGHGTHVAGTIATLNNDIGVIGVAPQAELYAIKALDQYGNGNYSEVISGIEWAIDNQMDIINMSLGGTTSSKALKAAVDKAYNSGMLLVASAGNMGYNKKGSITYPAAYDSVIAVGAIDQQNIRASFSSVGRQLELMAPGVGIESTFPNNSYSTMNGTSMASPHVAGAAALMWESNPTLTNVELRQLLKANAIPLGDSFEYGNGLINFTYN